MKLFKTLTCVFILTITFVNYTEAKGRSFGGGFRSQRMAPPPRVQRAPQQQTAPATQTTQPKSMFGSFGTKPAGAAPQNAQPLNMSKDLNANAAQRNALKTNDSRTAAGTTAGATGASNSGWFGSGNPAATKATPMQSAQPGAMQQRGGGGFMNNAMWFMLGSSLASNRHAPANQDTQQTNPPGDAANSANVNGVTNVNDVNSANSANSGDVQAIDPLPSMAPDVVEKESFFMSFLRLTLWAAIIFGVYKLIKNIMQARQNRVSKKPNYTFGN